MIGKLSGVIDSTGDDWAMIDVAGVGYKQLLRIAPLDSQQQIWILSGSWPCPATSRNAQSSCL